MSWPLRTPCITWSELIQRVLEGSYPGQSTITFLPMIDMQPTNMSCVYSTLYFASNLTAKYKVKPGLIFFLIVNNESAEIESHLRYLTLRVGEFHTQMSYLGTISHLVWTPRAPRSDILKKIFIIFMNLDVSHQDFSNKVLHDGGLIRFRLR